MTRDPKSDVPYGFWDYPALIQRNNFIYKSLSCWSFNIAVGCGHACRFCYVPSVSTIKQTPLLIRHGVRDPDAEWGDYVFLRKWDEKKFRASLREAERTPLAELNPDGNRAVMFCTTTDPYQVFRHPDSARQKTLSEAARHLVRRSLELIRDQSPLNVRILTRSPLARQDFDLFKSFGKRLVFGMSLPTLRNDLSAVYEPRAPAPSQRLLTLQKARDAGLHTYVAMAPTYPECDEDDLRRTLTAIADLDPITIFHEPINIRAENVQRISEHAASLKISLRTEVFSSREAWKDYALGALKTVQKITKELGLSNRLHLWPDRALGAKWVIQSMPKPDAYEAWLKKRWRRISEWPRRAAPGKRN